MEPSKTKLDGNDTTTLLRHPYILCHFANYADHKILYMHLVYLPDCMNKVVSITHVLHSLPHKRTTHIYHVRHQ